MIMHCSNLLNKRPGKPGLLFNPVNLKYYGMLFKHTIKNETMQNEQFSIAGIAAELGVSEEEVQQAVETVGSDSERIKEFITRNHTETDTTDDADNEL